MHRVYAYYAQAYEEAFFAALLNIDLPGNVSFSIELEIYYWIISGNESVVVLMWMVDWLAHGRLIQVGWIPCVPIVGWLCVDGLIWRVHVDGGAWRRVVGVLSHHVLSHEFFPLSLAVAVAGDGDDDGDSDDTSNHYPSDEPS